jgi:hypothetical protein
VNCNDANRKLSVSDYNKIGAAGKAFLYEVRQKSRDRSVNEVTTGDETASDKTPVKSEKPSPSGNEKGGRAGQGFGKGAYQK